MSQLFRNSTFCAVLQAADSLKQNDDHSRIHCIKQQIRGLLLDHLQAADPAGQVLQDDNEPVPFDDNQGPECLLLPEANPDVILEPHLQIDAEAGLPLLALPPAHLDDSSRAAPSVDVENLLNSNAFRQFDDFSIPLSVITCRSRAHDTTQETPKGHAV